VTKYRKPVLRGEIALRLRELVRQICTTLDVYILSGHVSADHVHLLVSVPPSISDKPPTDDHDNFDIDE